MTGSVASWRRHGLGKGIRRSNAPLTALAIAAALALATAPGAMGLFAQGPKLLASDGAANDQFGYAVAISGDRLVIGADYDDDKGTNAGSAYVFERSAAGTWTQTQKLLANDGAGGDNFGWSVAISGDRILIGAVRDSDKGIWSGSAYVFERNAAGTWAQTQKLLASDGAAQDYFGYAVGISGDRLVIGARGDDDNGPNAGSAYVFERSAAGTWTQTRKLSASGGSDFFGWSVAIGGDRIVVGSPLNNFAWVFERDAAGTWTFAQRLFASSGGGHFGGSVAISGDRLVVGAETDADNGPYAGSAHVFERNAAGTWKETQKLRASDGARDDRFGWSVAVSGDHVLIGAFYDDDKGANSGSAYVFERNAAGTWTQTQKLLASDGAAGDEFGSSVAMSGGRLVIGAPLDDDKGANSGSAYVFRQCGPDVPGAPFVPEVVCDVVDALPL